MQPAIMVDSSQPFTAARLASLKSALPGLVSVARYLFAGATVSGSDATVPQPVAAPLATEEIAARLFVSINTVKTHVRSILRKLSASRRNEAVRRARARTPPGRPRSATGRAGASCRSP